MNTPSEDYHALLARHDAMRLRRRILAPAGSSAEPWSAEAPQAYDGSADQLLISDSLALVSPLEELVAELYLLLFERHPYLRSLFPESMAFQQVHLVGIFRYLISNLHRTEEMIGVFGQLGRDHRKLGVRPAHFEAFEAALLEALRVRAGVRWTRALEHAWLRMLRLAVSAMVRGADEAIAEPPSWDATVTSHELRAPDLAVLRVRPHQPYAFEAGQYASLESPLLEQAWRSYYLARAPHPDGELEFHVRARGAGGVSDALVHGTRVRGAVRLSAPRGALALPEHLPSADILLVASGTGWAPMKALLQRIDTDRSRTHRVRLLLGLTAPEESAAAGELYDGAYLEAFRRGRPWLTVVAAEAAEARFAGAGLRALNGTTTPYRGAAARQHAFLSLAPEAPEAAAAGYARDVSARLAAAGVPAAHIHHETNGIVAVTEASASTARTGLLSA
ncbi:globin domain-containing protein [Streptomyces sp. NBC_00654]|uniref:globin domain-containing protein n=1 Tax=Streptomyces sp. NBC_00654 TaxID=2975799 RepID=UPI002252AB58|nr:globin domain-containing protein [Streptomyces sp. NBC_00654]MCX4967491.1 globin domain-containing protein [Streptomyces sp. NBC_00654]